MKAIYTVATVAALSLFAIASASAQSTGPAGQDTTTKGTDTMSKDGMKGGMTKDTKGMSGGSMSKDTMSKDGMKNGDSMSKDGMKKDSK